MRLPFSTDAFFGVFQRYNEAVWPAQVGLVLIALLAVVLAAGGGEGGRSRVVAGILALLWFWMGVVYHLVFFRVINPVAVAFGGAFVTQGALLLWYGVRHQRLAFRAGTDVRGVAGGLLIGYALVGYPPSEPCWDMPIPRRPRSACPVRRRSSRSACSSGPRRRCPGPSS